MQLVDKEDDRILVSLELHDQGLQAFLELPAVLGPGDHRGDVQRDDALVFENLGNFLFDDFLGETFHDGGLSDAGFPDEDRIVLFAAAENLDQPLDFRRPSDDRVELSLAGESRQIAPEMIENRRLGLVFAFRTARGEILDGIHPRRTGFVLDIFNRLLERRVFDTRRGKRGSSLTLCGF